MSSSPRFQLAVGTGQPLIGNAIFMFSPARTVMSFTRLRSILGFSVVTVKKLLFKRFCKTITKNTQYLSKNTVYTDNKYIDNQVLVKIDLSFC